MECRCLPQIRRRHIPATELERYEGTELFAVGADGRTLVTFAVDASHRPATYDLLLWDPSTGKETVRIECNDHITSMAISPDCKLLSTISTSGDGGQLTVWELPSGTKKLEKDWSKYGEASFTNDSAKIVAPIGINGLAVFDLETKKITAKRVKNLAKTLTVKASPTEPIVAIGLGEAKRPAEKLAAEGTMAAPSSGAALTKKEREELLKKRQQQLQEQQQRAQAAAAKKRGKRGKHDGGSSMVDPNELLGLEPDAEGVVQIYNLETGKNVRKLYISGVPSDLVFNTAGTRLAAWAVGGAGMIWDVEGWIEDGRLGRFVPSAIAGANNANPGAVPPPPPPPPMQVPGAAGGNNRALLEPSGLALSDNGSWAVNRQSSDSRSPGQVWDTFSGQAKVLDPAPAACLGFLADGTVVMATREKPLRFFEPKALKEVYPPFRAK